MKRLSATNRETAWVKRNPPQSIHLITETRGQKHLYNTKLQPAETRLKKLRDAERAQRYPGQEIDK